MSGLLGALIPMHGKRVGDDRPAYRDPYYDPSTYYNPREKFRDEDTLKTDCPFDPSFYNPNPMIAWVEDNITWKSLVEMLALESALEAMRKAGYLKTHGAVRIDSTHMLADLAAMSRLECVRETLRMSLEFLVCFGGASTWEPWRSRYAERHPKELRDPPVERLVTTMETAGADCAAVLV